MAEALRLALSLFTVAPMPAGRVDRRRAGRAMALAPFVGAGLALVAAGVMLGARLLYQEHFGLPLIAALTIGTLALLTRGLHLDGLVDTADGLASYAGREKALQIMREPAAGALGVVTLVFTVLVQTGALMACIHDHRGTQSLLLAVVAGRLAAVLACTPGTPAARPEGLGALVAGSVRPAVALALTGAVALEAALYGLLDADAGSPSASLRAVLALAAGLAVADLLRRHAVRRLGGITGDVLGALVETCATVVLLVMAVGD